MNDEMKTAKEIENATATPEQLLQLLSGQLAAQRSQRGKPARNRATILVVGVLFIIIAAGVSLLVLDRMVAELRQNPPPAANSEPPVSGNF